MKKHFLCTLFLVLVIYQQTFDHTLEEKKIVVITCMYNNEQWVEKNLSLIFGQKYTNFRVIVIDDASTDRTAEMIQSFITTNEASYKTTFIKNKTRKRKLANLYTILHTVDDDDIVIIIDGDDWLAHPYVFAYINNVYDQDIFFTYGQYQNIPASESIAWGFNPMGYAKPIPEIIVKNHSYRKGPFYYMHLRTFKGWIFKQIKLQDLISDTVEGFVGDFFPASNDLAMYYPIVEMAHTKIHFVQDILYMRNVHSRLVGFKVDRKIQISAAQEIKRKTAYTCLEKPVYRYLDNLKEKDIDVIVDTKNIKKYASYKKQLPKSVFLKTQDVRPKAHTLCNDYILISFDENYFPSKTNIQDMIYQLERAFAQALFCFEKKVYKKTVHSLPIACLKEQKLYAGKHSFLLTSITNIHDAKSILVRTTDFKNIIKENKPIKQAVYDYLRNNQSNISLLFFI